MSVSEGCVQGGLSKGYFGYRLSKGVCPRGILGTSCPRGCVQGVFYLMPVEGVQHYPCPRGLVSGAYLSKGSSEKSQFVQGVF